MKRFWPLPGAFLLVVLLAAACNGDSAPDETTPATDDPPASSPAPAVTPMTFSERPPLTIDPEGKYVAVVETTKGTFRIELRPDLAPETVNSFIFLAQQGFYNGVTFHRVIPGFVAQGGDPTGTGSGGPGYTLPAEFSDEPYERGTVGMARTADPNSGGSQFFITYDRQASLDGQYTVFGMVTEGMEVVEALTPRDPTNITTPQPARGDAILSITIEESS